MSHAVRFTAEKIAQRLALIQPFVVKDARPIAPFRFERLADARAEPGSGEDCGVLSWGDYWAGQDTHFVLRSRFAASVGWLAPALHLPLGVAGDIFNHPEALLSIDGAAFGSADRYHHTIALPPAMADGAEREMTLHGWTGLTGWPPDPTDPTRLLLRECRVVDLDRDLEAFITRAGVALDVARALDETRTERHDLLSTLDRAFLALDTRRPGSDAFRASVAAALTTLNDSLADAPPPMDVDLFAIGHAHIDVAYLWPLAQARRKNARTTANVLRLMARFPEYRFSHSQPQLYAWLEQDRPEMFEAVRERVSEGRWEVLGGMWVEPDCNMPGPESLVRQILLARRYAESRFGQPETPALWLPDTFGFPASLPQLMKQAGLRWFVTNKVNWNQTNRMPSSTTWWEGIDGSRVLAQFLTTPRPVQHLPFPTNYKSDLSAAEVLGTWSQNTAKRQVRDLPICYGYGDGGGGPTEALIRKARAYAALPAAPRLRPATVREFFETLEAKAPDLPVWSGELYMEGHRGVLTSQGWIKRANRQAEGLLADAEYLGALATLRGGAPADLSEAWRRLCVNQFHDILTGTSITAVFDEARRDFEAITAQAQAAIAQAADALAEGAGETVFDGAPLPAPRLLESEPEAGPFAVDGLPLPRQNIEGGVLHELPQVEHGHAFHRLAPAKTKAPAPEAPVEARLEAGLPVLENRFLRVDFAADGTLARIFDKISRRDVLAPGARGNLLQAFEDRPISWDAWDIDPFFEDRPELVDGLEAMTIRERGPLRAAVTVRRRWRDSLIEQHIRLTRRSRRIDFVTRIHWRERHTLLKAAFPVAIRAQAATYDIQWGHIERPTHRNTSWDSARFEVAAQKWAHLGEADYGVALLNDGKYGHDIRDSVMRLSLIKSPTSPDPTSDLGEHAFSYALLPHPGDWRAWVPAEAYVFNRPLRRLSGAIHAPPIAQSLSANIVIETVKPAEDGDGVIIRFYEAHRQRGTASIVFAPEVRTALRADLLETCGALVAIHKKTAQLSIKPFEIATLKLQRRLAGD